MSACTAVELESTVLSKGPYTAVRSVAEKTIFCHLRDLRLATEKLKNPYSP